VSDPEAAGLISAGMNLHWGGDEIYEIDYVPDGTAVSYEYVCR
jgi:hypothetical protein